MKIYTKAGDDGSTGLYGGDRVSKVSARIHAIGEVDELNACLGVAHGLASGILQQEIGRIQNWLFDLGAELASPPGGKFEVRSLTDAHAGFLERSIDRMTADLPPLKAFILPGGSPLAAELHRCRAVCRRAERVVLVLDAESHLRDEVRAFLNRLSDWLFTAARTANAEIGVLDIEWQKSEEF